MVATVGTDVSEGRTFAITSGKSAFIRATEGKAFAVYRFTTPGERVSQTKGTVVVKRASDMKVSEVKSFAIVQGRIDSHRVQAFPFRLDGHDYIALRLGLDTTLVYDVTTQQWSEWNSGLTPAPWRPTVGMNWTGMTTAFYTDGQNSDVVLGDDTFGVLWGLDPQSGVDDAPDPNVGIPQPYIRKVVGGIPMRMRETQKAGAAYITGSFGNPQYATAGITLRTSDDFGKTWTDQGTVTVQPGNYDQEFVWRSLGLIKAPGRIFEISDNGATVRLDSLDVR